MSPEGIAAKNAAKTKADKAKTESLFKRLAKFLAESKVEVFKKATWPSRAEVQKHTTVVIVAILIVAAYIGGLDAILTLAFKRIFG